MSSPPPTKPPRGVKQGKETSGLLMSVIRTLSASETNELREKERAKLEKEYKKSDARLDELVGAHATEIMEVMQKFTAASAGLSAWDQHCDAAVARLAACRGLLQLKRDDLYRLWVDARTHHYALEMLTEIERVIVSPRAVSSELSCGRVLSAGTALQTARRSLTALSHVTALDHTRTHLENLRRTLVDKIVKDLSVAVYGSEPIQKDNSKRRINMLLAELMKPEEVTESCLQEITPEFEASLSEDDRTFETNVMISLEALGVLEQLKEATEMFKVQIQSELLEVIEKMSRRIIDEGDIELDSELEQDSDMQQDEGVSETGRPLAKLISCLSEEFRACAARNRRLIQLWRAALQKFKISDSCLHTEQQYWSAVQQVLQLLLSEYLEMDSVTQEAARASSAADAAPPPALHAYYSRKKQPKTRGKLYKITSLSTPSPLPARFPLVCARGPRLLYALLPPLSALGAHIEQALGGSECSLRAFVTDYVRTGEADRLAADARREVDRHMGDVGAWRHVDTDDSTSSRPVLRVVSLAWHGISLALVSASRCQWAGGAFVCRRALLAVAAAARHCQHHQNRLTPHSSVRAAKWLADDDIVRFLQSLPNWKVAISTETISEDKLHEEELQQAYEREAEILGSSLGDSSVFKKEIIADVSTLADIALMCESMNWLKTQVRSIPSLLGPSMKLPDDLLKEIAVEALKFEEIEHKCLLLLHLELRIQCFHYLCGSEADAGASKLAHALLALHEVAAHVLQKRKMDYIVCGVGEMMSVGVVRAGRGRLPALRHCLAALGLPLAGLQRAMDYLQLMANTPQEIIENIREKGPQFSELEYLNAFKIIGEKRGLPQSEMKGHLKQLSSALGHIGVTV